MEEMNNITEMVETTTLEVPVTGAETVNKGVSVLGTIASVATVIVGWEGIKFVGKKVYAGLKKVFKKKSQEDIQVEEEAIEAEVIDQE